MPALERRGEGLRAHPAVDMRKSAHASGFLIPNIVCVRARAQIVMMSGIPEIPQRMQHLFIVIVLGSIHLDEVEPGVETAGRNPCGQACEIPIGYERMVDLHDGCALAACFLQDRIDGCGAGIDRKFLVRQERVGVEMAPGRGELDRRNERDPAAIGDPLQHLVVHRRVVIAHEEKIEPGRKLRARKIRRRRHCLSLIRMVVHVGRVPPLRRRIE